MKRPRRLALVVAALFACGVAWSQSSADVRAAQADFRRGVAALGAQRPDEAAAALEASYARYPSPVALYNLALARRALGQRRRAIDAFERYLREEHDLRDARRAAIEAAVRGLRAELATLRLRVSTAPYAVLIDGDEAAVRDDAVPIDPGEHAVVVRAEGHRPARFVVTATSGATVAREVTLEADEAPREPAAAHAVTPAAAPSIAAAPAAAPSIAAEPVVAPSTRPATVTPHPAPSAPVEATPSLSSRWWFWTGLGLLVAGGVAASLWAAQESAVPEVPVTGTRFDVVTGAAR